MTPIDVIGSQPGRVLRIVTGGALIAGGVQRRRPALAAVGLVPLAAGAADVCLLGPLVGGPLRGKEFRAHRSRNRLARG